MKLKKLNSLRGAALRCDVRICLTWLVAVQAAVCSTSSRTLLRLHPTPSGSFAVALNQADPISAPPTPANLENASLHAPADQPFLVIGAQPKASVEVEVENIPGWRAILSPDSYISIRPLHENQDLQVIADKGNPEDVRIVLPDGAQASLSGGNSLRLETFRDHSYNLFARGTTQARSADGAVQTLDTLLPPLSGGPVMQVKNEEGQLRLRRVTPSTQLRLVETSDQPLTAHLDEQATSLEDGTPQRLTQANGASVLLTRKPEGIRFEVERGYFILVMPTVPGCQPHVWTGQSGQVRWDAQLKAVEVTPEGSPILVALPKQRHATVQPGSSLQVAQLGEHTFAASASGNGVELYDSHTRRQLRLDPTQTVLQSRPSAAADNRIDLTLSADVTGQFILTDRDGRQRRLTAVEEDWTVDPEHTLRARHDPEAELLQLQALVGVFAIEMPAASLSFELNELNGMKWQMGPDQSTTRGRSLETNPTAVAVRTQSGQILLSAGGELLVMGPSWMTGLPRIFSNALEPAGEPKESSLIPVGSNGSSWLLGLDPDQIYTPRVEQPPVSVVR